MEAGSTGHRASLKHTDHFLQAKTAHNSYVGQKVKDDINDIMSELDTMKKKNVNNLFTMGAPAPSIQTEEKKGAVDPDIFDGLEIGPKGELIIKTTNQKKNIEQVNIASPKKPEQVSPPNPSTSSPALNQKKDSNDPKPKNTEPEIKATDLPRVTVTK